MEQKFNSWKKSNEKQKSNAFFLIGLICAALSVFAILIALLFLDKPIRNSYRITINAQQETIERTYGEPLDLSSVEISYMTFRRQEKTVKADENMIDGYDPEKIGTYKVTITIEFAGVDGTTIDISGGTASATTMTLKNGENTFEFTFTTDTSSPFQMKFYGIGSYVVNVTFGEA